MELIISQSDLSKALSFIQSIVERKTTMPILANVLLSAEKEGGDKGRLRLSATDLEITAVVEVSAEVKSSGATTVTAKVLNDVVKELPNESVRVQLSEGERLHLAAGSSNFSIIGVHSEEFPSLPGIGIRPDHVMRAGQLREMIQKTVYAVSHDETRFNLNGVCFESEVKGKGKSAEAVLRLVATDGHRLSLIQRGVEGMSFEGSHIVPTKGLLEVRKLLDELSDQDVEVTLSDGFFVVEGRNTSKGMGVKVSMRLIDGEFPDYKQVLPKKEGVEVKVSAHDLMQALRRAALMVSDKGKCVKLDFVTGKLRISSSSPELGESTEEIEIDYKGEHMSVGFNARYLLDFCGTLGEESTMVLKLSGELGPAKLYADNDDSHFGIVMPMRLN